MKKVEETDCLGDIGNAHVRLFAHTSCWFALHDVCEASEKHREHIRSGQKETTMQERDKFVRGTEGGRIYAARWIGMRRCHRTAGHTQKQLILVHLLGYTTLVC